MPRMTRPGDDSAARETVLSSSRMLPGQWYCSSRSVASFENALAVERQAVRGAVAREEALRQDGNVGGALAQRRQPDGEGVDAVVEILAEARVADELVERAVGRRNQPEVDFDRVVAAQPLEAPLLEHAQQLGLADECDMSPISSRNSVPLLASSSRPGLRSCAPVKAPFS